MQKQPTDETPPDHIERTAFTVDEFCQRNCISRSSFYRILEAGKLKAKKRGSRTIVLASDELEWLNRLPEYKPAAKLN